MTDGTSIATYEGYMSRESGNIECTSTLMDVDVSTTSLKYVTLDNQMTCNSMIHDLASIDSIDVVEDLYSHQYGLETIKTISNTVTIVTKNIIIPLINGTGTMLPVMILFCIRDSLREYKFNYVILSNMKISLYN